MNFGNNQFTNTIPESYSTLTTLKYLNFYMVRSIYKRYKQCIYKQYFCMYIITIHINI